MEVDIINAKTGQSIISFSSLKPTSTIHDVKLEYKKLNSKLSLLRYSFRKEPRGRILRDEETLASLGFNEKAVLYFKDLGPQVGWTTVFITEYAGPPIIYAIFYMRPSFIYGIGAANDPKHFAVELAAGCWIFHFVKRLLETVFVHRFSHATMPIRNIFKNSIYYWGFAAFVAYYINHPLYTPPRFGDMQIYGALTGFILAELGNFSIHVALRNLRPKNSKVRMIPYPGLNPFTYLFNFVACPNYTYEYIAWQSFAVMTQCLPAQLFALAGFYQMAVWARGKLSQNRKEFKQYPKNRKAIVPFIF
ncbi:very-long-chain enoyl-CoA reductase-like [Argonauta hians]